MAEDQVKTDNWTPKPDSKTGPSTITDKKALLNWKTNLDLHTLLVMKTHGLSKGQALVQVYAEGVEGLSKRLVR